ncbi:hypothetical protein SS50377_22852 [Spironucleus salmonicida]|uniref:Uncharacterized protein n=1 Tax=Spironucleus salmonicida TaxID=348837 RepID=V6LTK0_9EUKA|nr:hypothetical protein SS50377_22837 [Spironucleus salmonicida]KAH0575225.1 hypothetical protein SS50377_22852 [Spironucleus salmonicida]|eukprot:EST47899.1 Hypothetical protein SS50377_12001 [Spironucleus salmonicida]
MQVDLQLDATLRYIDRYQGCRSDTPQKSCTQFAGYATVRPTAELYPLPALPPHRCASRKPEVGDGRQRLNEVRNFRRGWRF